MYAKPKQESSGVGLFTRSHPTIPLFGLRLQRYNYFLEYTNFLFNNLTIYHLTIVLGGLRSLQYAQTKVEAARDKIARIQSARNNEEKHFH